MGASMWHALDHLDQDIREVGGMGYIHGSMYDKSHKIITENYGLTSKRVASVFSEVVSWRE